MKKASASSLSSFPNAGGLVVSGGALTVNSPWQTNGYRTGNSELLGILNSDLSHVKHIRTLILDQYPMISRLSFESVTTTIGQNKADPVPFSSR